MKKSDDNMDKLYKENPEHYDTGLIKIGLSEKQARGYSSYFRSIRDYYYDKIEKTYKECIKDKSEIYILDVGSGLGEDAHALNRIVPNAKIYGIEVSKEAVSICQNQAKNNMIFIHGSITEPQCNNFQPNSFDIITNFTTLEHVGDPEKMIEICSYLLKPGGLLISAVPNHIYWKFWMFPAYFACLVRNKYYLCHSVEHQRIIKSANENRLLLLDYDVIGFRPPQDFFKFIPESIFSYVIGLFKKIDRAYRNLGLKRLLYIEIFTHIKKNSNSKSCIKLKCTPKNRNFCFYIVSPFLVLMSAFFVFCNWARILTYIIKSLYKKIFKR